MNPIETFVKEVNLFAKRCDNLNNNDQLSKQQFIASAVRVSAFMLTAGFAVLAATSLFAASAAGVVFFGILAILAHDVYQLAKNKDEMELQSTGRSLKRAGKILLNTGKGACKGGNLNLEFNKSWNRSLTENTIFLRPLTSLVGTFVRA